MNVKRMKFVHRTINAVDTVVFVQKDESQYVEVFVNGVYLNTFDMIAVAYAAYTRDMGPVEMVDSGPDV